MLILLFCLVVYWWYKQKRKIDYAEKSKSEISPTAVLLVTSYEEWENAYQTLMSDLSVVKVRIYY